MKQNLDSGDQELHTLLVTLLVSGAEEGLASLDMIVVQRDQTFLNPRVRPE